MNGHLKLAHALRTVADAASGCTATVGMLRDAAEAIEKLTVVAVTGKRALLGTSSKERADALGEYVVALSEAGYGC